MITVKDEIQENLSNRLLQRGIITETVSITEFRFSSTFVAAIEAKVAAEQAVWEARNKLERVKVEAEQAEAEAMGEASARIAKAEGEAEYIRVVTDAQVAANKAIAESLTPQVLQYILLDRLGEDIKVIVRLEKKVHWHIDYLLREAPVAQIWYGFGQLRIECTWNAIVRGLPRAMSSIPGFGTSDCQCSSHLIYFPTIPSFNLFRQNLRQNGLPQAHQLGLKQFE